MDFFEGNRKVRRRDAVIAGGFFLAAVFLFLLPAGYQRPVRDAMRSTVLQPFLLAQAQVVSRRSQSLDAKELRAQNDSLRALVLALAPLVEENRLLRELQGLGAAVSEHYRSAQIARVALPGAESTFMVELGERHGVYEGSPVVGPDGLVGVIWVVESGRSQGIDWTHPEFRASAMTADGEVYGIVEPRRGRFREEDVLVLTGASFFSDVRPGTRIQTSGAGGVLPRGIPIGTVVGIEEAEAGWRKSYLVRPAMRPEAATHVLVGVRTGGERGAPDPSSMWPLPAATGEPVPPADTTADGAGDDEAPTDSAPAGAPAADRAPAGAANGAPAAAAPDTADEPAAEVPLLGRPADPADEVEQGAEPVLLGTPADQVEP